MTWKREISALSTVSVFCGVDLKVEDRSIVLFGRAWIVRWASHISQTALDRGLPDVLPLKQAYSWSWSSPFFCWSVKQDWGLCCSACSVCGTREAALMPASEFPAYVHWTESKTEAAARQACCRHSSCKHLWVVRSKYGYCQSWASAVIGPGWLSPARRSTRLRWGKKRQRKACSDCSVHAYKSIFWILEFVFGFSISDSGSWIWIILW